MSQKLGLWIEWTNELTANNIKIFSKEHTVSFNGLRAVSLKKRNKYFYLTRIQLNWSNVRVKTFIMLFSNKCWHFELSIHQRILKNVSRLPTKILIIDIDNNQIWFFWAANQPIKMIPERSYDNEDWRNDAENSAFITGIHSILK